MWAVLVVARLHVITHYLTEFFMRPSFIYTDCSACDSLYCGAWFLCLGKCCVTTLLLFPENQPKGCSSAGSEKSHVSHKIATLPFRNGWLSRFYFSWVDPTRIIQGPVDTEIIVGESIVLPCQVTSDPVLDVSFSWAFNGQLIAKGDGHFEFVGGVSDPQP